MTAFPVGPLTVAGGASAGSATARRVWRIAAIVAVLVATAVTVAVAWGATHPSFPYDEVDQLQMSRFLAGLVVPDVGGAGYYPAWSVLLVPVWWFTSDPFAVYNAAIVLGGVLGLAAIVPLAFIARRFRLTADQAVVAAAIVVTLPAVAIQADYALSERMLLLAVAFMVLATWRLWERPAALRAVLFGLSVGVAYFTHVRMLVVVAAAILWIVLFALRSWRVAAVGFVALGIFSGAAHFGGRALNIALLGAFGQSASTLASLRNATPELLALSGLGQAWAQVVGTFCLAIAGLVGLAYWSWRELRRVRAGRATFLLGAFLALYLLTTIKWASEYHLFTRDWRRLDVWIYGRYIDPLVSILVLIGVALLIRGIRRVPLVWAAGVSLVIIVPTVWWVAPKAPTWGFITPAHLPGTMPWFWALPTKPFPAGSSITPTFTNENRFWLIASVTAVVVLALVAVLRRRPIAIVALLVVVAAAASLVADRASDRFRSEQGVPPAILEPLRDALARSGPVDVQYDTGCGGTASGDTVVANYYGWWLLPSILRTFDSRETTATAELIVSCAGVPLDGVPDAVEIPGSASRSKTLWVRPGALADALRDGGVLP